ncbi:Phosphoribosylglycinamide formyltransferase [Moorella thermoacetica]|uniref:Phosphoribosylglycinamide formyltransferase n=1 Tax=Neomoorella thermoacetica TaxID=1525 RepID=A0A1J5JQF3_NEOTH|nr:phosphoribosylglycinamide formyltransferase [Moorella thermoacetica]OIQ08931.1 phosphoribosylglycinamide formyltransferase [Moorella thermoacetica]OIQ11158.1 phosphoribosylglycinamide formyltransferase [Moorella thermoacetica]
MVASTLPIGILVSGRGSNMEAIAAAIEAGEVPARIQAVISDRPEARALELARERGLKAFCLAPGEYPSRQAYDLALATALKKEGVELVALAGFMRLLGREFLEQFPGAVINIHPALLPAFPGLNAQRQALEYGVKVSGCTVHFVDAGMDTGPIIAQAVVPVRNDDTPETLAARILAEEHRLYPRVIKWLAEGRVELRGRRVIVRS